MTTPPATLPARADRIPAWDGHTEGRDAYYADRHEIWYEIAREEAEAEDALRAELKEEEDAADLYEARIETALKNATHCPFCRGRELDIDVVAFREIRVVCKNRDCGCRGPKGTDDLAAITGWNIRHI